MTQPPNRSAVRSINQRLAQAFVACVLVLVTNWLVMATMYSDGHAPLFIRVADTVATYVGFVAALLCIAVGGYNHWDKAMKRA